MTDTPPTLMGSAEIAALFDVSRQRVQQLIGKPDFPAPAADLAMGKVWDAPAVRAWGIQTRRLAPNCARCARPSPSQTSAEFKDWEALGDGGAVVCPDCITAEEQQAVDEDDMDTADQATPQGAAGL